MTLAAIKSIAADMKQKAKDRDGNDLKEDDLSAYLQSLMLVRTIPREQSGVITVNVSAMATSDLLDTSRHVCHDSGSGTGISVDSDDFVWLDETENAKKSVSIRGPSVGGPGCGGRGALVFRVLIEGKPFGLIHPEGVLAKSEMKFRVSSERICKARGVRVVTGEFDKPDFLECVRTKKRVNLETVDNILVMETEGKASDIIDSPEFREVVQDIRMERRSPLVDLAPFLPAKDKEEKVRFTHMTKDVKAQQEASVMIFNEAKAEPEERARLWCRRLAYCDTAKFSRMANMPEFGDFPNLPHLNEDNLYGDKGKFARKPFKPNDPSITMDCPPWWRVYVDGYGGQQSLGGESYEGAVGSYLFVCCATGSVDVKLYASHTQFPVALHQFLRRVEAEHYKVHVMYGDTFSVNMSEDVEEVCALFQCTLLPVSAGTPQEMAFAESMVRVIKRMSTAMLAGAPHLSKEMWACSDKYAVFLHDFLPQSTRQGHCPFYLRTGRTVNWRILPIHVFGAQLCYAPLNGPIHKRAPITLPGIFVGVQWPAILIQREEDGKIISCSRQKCRVYEKPYTAPLDQTLPPQKISEMQDRIAGEDSSTTPQEVCQKHTSRGGFTTPVRPEFSKPMVQSIRSLREHRFNLPGKNDGITTELELSAASGNADQNGGEGLYYDEVTNQASFDQLTKAIAKATEAAGTGVSKPSVRDQVIAKLKSAMDIASKQTIEKGGLKKGKKQQSSTVSTENVIQGKRKRETVIQAESDKDSPPVEDNPVTDHEVFSHQHTPSFTSKKSSKVPFDATKQKRRGRPPGVKVGDLVSLPSKFFDGENAGSFSGEHPEDCIGQVLSIKKNGLTQVRWLDDNETYWVRMKDLTLKVRKRTIANIIVLLVEGEQIAFEAKDKNEFPKNFFELLVKSDWRKWVECVKKELTGWDENKG